MAPQESSYTGTWRRGVRAAVAGSAMWILGILTLRPELAVALFLIGPLVVLPLGLWVLVPAVPPWGRWSLAQRWQLGAALSLLGSFAFEPGPVAAACEGHFPVAEARAQLGRRPYPRS